MNTFTYEDALIIQAQHLREWKRVLKPSIYKLVEAEVLESNAAAQADATVRDSKRGYLVTRGQGIENIVHSHRIGS